MKTSPPQTTAAKSQPPAKKTTAKRFTKIERHSMVRVTTEVSAEALRAFSNWGALSQSSFGSDVFSLINETAAPHLRGDALQDHIEAHLPRPTTPASITFETFEFYWVAIEQYAADHGIPVAALVRAALSARARRIELFLARKGKAA
ncbi:MAG: hypothetical protein V4819_00955 [Verrucomicrobiota bacterium]